jgi:hypothetical protein
MVPELWPKHDPKVPSMFEREPHIAAPDSFQVRASVVRRFLSSAAHGLHEQPISLLGDGRQQVLTAFEVVVRRSRGNPRPASDGMKAERRKTVLLHDAHGSIDQNPPQITVVVSV